MSDILIHRSQVNADNLNSRVEFDSAFGVDVDGNIIDAPNVYAPRVEHSDTEDIYIDSDEWEAFSIGYTGQYSYNGAVMHADEYLGGALAAAILSTPGTYVVTAVEVDCEDGACYMDCIDVDSPEEAKRARDESGCDCFPAGWTVLTLKNEN